MSIERSHKILQKLPSPWTTFFLIYSFFYLLPSCLLYLNFENNRMIPEAVYSIATSSFIPQQTLTYFVFSAILFFIGYLIPLLLLFLLSGSMQRKSSTELLHRNLAFQNPLFSQMQNLILLAGITGASISIFYFFYIALGMFGNLGGEMSNADFRFILFDEKYKYFNILLEVARRILLPISVSFLMFQSLIVRGKLSILAKFFWLILFFSGVMTLDRGPVMLALALLIVYVVLSASSLRSAFLKLILPLSLVIIMGGLVTQLQYNSTNFSFTQMIMQGFTVIINRLFFDPAVMSLIYSFTEVDGVNEPLHLKFSRIGVLWGQEYVGTMDDNSIYVTPVSIIGDIWRNFGISLMLYFGSAISIIFLIITYFTNRSIILFRLPIVFLTIIWSFYVIVGTLFSIGVFGILFIILILSTVSFMWAPEDSIKP